jgi:branched-chain amino acid aminotransferase
MLGNVTGLTNANVFITKFGVVLTPVPNGTFLNGITRQRIIHLLRYAGVEVIEKSLQYRDFELADEIFATGNYAKVIPVTRIGDRTLLPGRFFNKARGLYWEFARSTWPDHKARKIAAAV